jgi:hypothetical protein
MVVLVLKEDARRSEAAASPAAGSPASPAASACEPGSTEAGVSIPSGRDLWHYPASDSPSPRSERSPSPTFSAEVCRLGFDVPPVGPPPVVASAPSPVLLRRSPPPPPPSQQGLLRNLRLGLAPLPGVQGRRGGAVRPPVVGARAAVASSPCIPAAAVAAGRWSRWSRRPPGVLQGGCISLAVGTGHSWFATWSCASSAGPATTAAGAPSRFGPCGFGRRHTYGGCDGGQAGWG